MPKSEFPDFNELSSLNRKIPSLNALKAFEAAARHESFRIAAEELCVSHSAISHQIKELENAVGVGLFERRGRGIVLSEAGGMLFPVVRDAFDRIAEGVGLIRDTRFSSEFRLQMYVTFAVRWLIPRLHQFTDANPDILVRLTTSQLGWGFDDKHADLGVIYSLNPPDAAYRWIELFKAHLTPVCSPAYLERHQHLSTPEQLSEHVWLRVYTTDDDDWHAWLAAQGLSHLAGRAGIRFDSYLLAYEAAIDGQGIAMAVDFLVEADLKTGALVPIFDLKTPQPGSWKVIWRRQRHHHPGIEPFCQWLIEEFAGMEPIAGA